MVKLASTLSRLNPAKVLVIGDLLLDTYTIGKARRISPEAPVAVVHVQQEEHRPGGAGNVILNLISLGIQVSAVGRIGRDWAGETLIQSIRKEGVITNSIVIQESYRTPIKNRIIAENQQVVRIDHEQIIPLSEPLEQSLIDQLPDLMQDIKIVAISDYGKGFLTPTLLAAVISQARILGIPVITDPKGHDFSKYIGSSIIKPNLGEAYVAANLSPHVPLDMAAKRILELVQADMLMVTRSESGISLFLASGERFDFPVRIRQVKDVTGAGDTVLAMLTCALANKLSYAEAAQLCNVAAGIAIERIGCARITLSDLAHRLLEEDVSNKIFDEEHLFALQEVLKARPFVLLAVDSATGLSSDLYKKIKQLKKDNCQLLIFITDQNPDDFFVDMLSSLNEVDFIVLHEESIDRLCSKVNPLEIYQFKEKKLSQYQQISDLMDRLNPRVVRQI